MYSVGVIPIEPESSAAAQLDENPYLRAAVIKQQDRPLNTADVGLVQAYATMALAFETRESRFVLDDRLRDLETLIRNGKGW